MPPKIRVVTFTPATGRPLRPLSDRDGSFLVDRYNDGDDSNARLDFLLDKIREASNEINDPADDLKVFTAPEWFFRKKDFPYTLNDTKQLINRLITESGSAEFHNWVIIPGTVYWGDKRSGDQWEVYNTCPVVSNGQLLSLVTKQQEADIAASRRGNESWGTGGTLNGAIQASTRLLQELGGPTNNTDIQGLFDFEELSFGLEICADHGPQVKRLKSQVTERVGNGMQEGNLVEQFNSRFVDLHIVISASASPSRVSVISKSGGYFMYCDGSQTDPDANADLGSNVIRVPGLSVHNQSVIPVSINTYLHKTFFPNPAPDLYQRFCLFTEQLTFEQEAVQEASQILLGTNT